MPCTGNPGKQAIKIGQMMDTLGRSNRTFLISFTGGGEPFLVGNLTDACSALTKKQHYVSLVTNLTSVKVEEFAERIDPKKVPFILASLHIKELERKGLVDRFVSNFALLKGKGFNMFAREVAHPSLLKEADKYRKYFMERGIELHFAPFFGKFNNRRYPDAYTMEELRVFGLNRKMDVQIFHQFGKLCNAGHNVAFVDENGDIRPCFNIKQNLGNIYVRIDFLGGLKKCPFKACECPLNVFYIDLFNEALRKKSAAGKPCQDF